MSITALGYLRSPAARVQDAPSADAQLAIIRGFCEEHGLKLADVFQDQADTARTAWLARPAGQQLAAVLKPGVQVVIADCASIYSKAADLLRAIQDLREQGVVLHIAAFKSRKSEAAFTFSTSGLHGDLMVKALQAMQTLNRSARSEAVREGMRARKEQGRKYCHHPGYGYVWNGRGGRKPDDYEQAIMAKIVEWKRAGWSWNQIAAHLLRQRVRTSAGREWSPARVRTLLCRCSFGTS